MKKIIAMVLLGIMVIGTFSPSISYAENVAVETEEETAWTESEIKEDFVEKYIGAEGYISENFLNGISGSAY